MSTDTGRTGGNRQTLEEASAWFVEFRLGEVDSATRRRFLGWLRRSPEHIRAYLEISGAYARLPTSGSVNEAEMARLIEHARSRNNLASFATDSESIPCPGVAQIGSVGWGRPWRVTRLAAAVAAIGIIVALGVWFTLRHAPTYETQTAEERTITLEDGSTLQLNARTRVRVHFSDARRDVELVQGQALFKVAKDAQRPFIVTSGGAVIRAVGTQFDVDREASGTTVTVLEGRVNVASQAQTFRLSANGLPAAPRELELSAGEQVIVTPAALEKSPHPNAAAATAWTRGRLEFYETPLSEAVMEFNRYSRRPLVIVSPELESLHINGVYSLTDNASGLLLFLRHQPDIHVDETETDIRIMQR
ncbi:MAG TPA: FecR domain-containing protein [Steroidobacteraceae bacterium]|jgi:transmembrane sensor|nr:FecR domain-containing protein [Steroidobacteraceae bacterium]